MPECRAGSLPVRLEVGPSCRRGQTPKPRRSSPAWFWEVANYLSSPQFPSCSSPWFTRPHSPCVKKRPPRSCVTMALACAKLASQEMTPPAPSFLPLWVALVTRYAHVDPRLWVPGKKHCIVASTGSRVCVCVCVCVSSKVRGRSVWMSPVLSEKWHCFRTEKGDTPTRNHPSSLPSFPHSSASASPHFLQPGFQWGKRTFFLSLSFFRDSPMPESLQVEPSANSVLLPSLLHCRVWWWEWARKTAMWGMKLRASAGSLLSNTPLNTASSLTGMTWRRYLWTPPVMCSF